jgi:uncharacterized protein
MKTYLFDIGHPSHVYYFKESIDFLKQSNKVIVVARDKDITFDLLQRFNIDFFSRGKGLTGLVNKFFYLLYAVAKILIITRFIKVDRVIGFGSPYAAISSRLKGADSVIFTDTEHAHLTYKLYKPFADHIVVNKFYNREITGNNLRVTRLSGFFEEIYLSQIPRIRGTLYPKKVLFRFVDWNAHHDDGYYGLKGHQLVDLVMQVSHFSDVYISSETDIPECLINFKINIASDSMHEFMSTLDLYIGESLTMGVESCLLGVPAIVVSATANLLGNSTAMIDYDIMRIENDVERIPGLAKAMLQNSQEYADIAEKIWSGSGCVKSEILNIIRIE